MTTKAEDMASLKGEECRVHTTIGDIEAHPHVAWEDVENYKWPMFQKGGPRTPNYNVIQAQNAQTGDWIPRWIIVDSDGTCIRMFELEEPLTPEDVAKAAYDIIRELHGITKEQTGIEGIIARVEVEPEAPLND